MQKKLWLPTRRKLIVGAAATLAMPSILRAGPAALLGAGGGSSGVAAYTAQGVIGNSGAWAKKTGALASVSDGKSGIMSVWVKNTLGLGAFRVLLMLRTTGVLTGFQALFSSSTGRLNLQGLDSGGTIILSIGTTTNLASASTWSHVLASWDLATTTGKVYLNNGDDTTSTTLTNSTIIYTRTTPSILADDSGGTPYGAQLADMQIWFNQFIDLTVAGNRAAFISGGAPVNPATGPASIGLPTADVRLSGPSSGWETNDGSGGGFTLQTGTITDASTNPP